LSRQLVKAPTAAKPLSGAMLPSYGGERRRAGAAEGAGREVLVLTHQGAIYPSAWERFAPYLAEFVGTFLLTLTYIYNYSASRSSVWTATSNGLMVVALMYALGHVSGANLNPSVSVALMLVGRHSPRVAARLCLSQTLGAISAAVVRLMFFSGSVDIGPQKGFTWGAVITIELLYSAMICFVYLNCAASMKNNPVAAQNGFVGLAVGFSFVAGGYAAREVSNSVMNTAIAVGLGVVDCKEGFTARALFYIFADFFGAFIGAGAYRIVRPDEDPNQSESRRDLSERKRQDGNSGKVAAEFFGTFFIIFTKALNRMGSAAEEGVGPEAWSVAAVLTSMVYSLRGVSGAYFNPAVTLAAVVSGRSTCERHVALFYVVAQFFAAVSAASLFSLLNHGQPIPLEYRSSQQSYGAKIFAETAFSFLITYVVLASSVSRSELASPSKQDAPSGEKVSGTLPNNDVAGFMYGACHTAGGFAAGHISGAMLNPAVVFSFCGMSALTGRFEGAVWAYALYHLFGALLATGVFALTHAGLYRQVDDEGDKEAVA